MTQSTMNLVLGCGAASLGSLTLVGFLYKYYQWFTSPLWNLPGPPKKSWLFGQLLEIIREPVFIPHLRWIKESKSDENSNLDMLHYSSAFGSHSICLLDANLVKQVLMARAHKDPKYVKKFPSIEKTVGDGLVTLSGSNWHRHRRIINPSFQVSFLKEQLTGVVPQKTLKLLSYWKDAVAKKNDIEIEIGSHLSQLTLDIIGQAGFSHDFHGMDSIVKWAEQIKNGETALIDKEGGSEDDLIALLRKTFKFGMGRVIMYMTKLDFLDFERERTVKALNKAVDQVIENARAKAEQAPATTATTTTNGHSDGSSNGEINSKYVAKSVLETLFHATDTESTPSSGLPRTLQNDELRDEIKTFIVAGHETTSTWCYWAVFALCKFPDVQQKVYEDIIKHAEGNTTISLEAIEKMDYFEAFMKECLRFYSPVPMMIRYNVYDENFNGTVIPANTRLILPIHLLHRSECYWSQPLEFKPERWLEEKQQPPYNHSHAFLPFSAGPRNCVGYKFAEIEAKLIMTHFIRSMRFQLAPSLRDTEFKYTMRLTSTTKPTVKICIQPRV